jgi:hypothetical protein
LIVAFLVASAIFTFIAVRLVDPSLRAAAARFLQPTNRQQTSGRAA